jgi:hypothetical protein
MNDYWIIMFGNRIATVPHECPTEPMRYGQLVIPAFHTEADALRNRETAAYTVKRVSQAELVVIARSSGHPFVNLPLGENLDIP